MLLRYEMEAGPDWIWAQLYGDADILFQQDLSTFPHRQSHFQVVWWPWYYCAWLESQHVWPEPHMESKGYFQEKRWKTVDPTIQTLPFHSSLLLTFVLKEPRPSIECINEHALKNLNFSVLIILFFIYVRKYNHILIYWIFTFMSCKP